MLAHLFKVGLWSCSLLFLAPFACGSGPSASGSSASDTTSGTGAGTMISGVAFKGPLNAATISIYALNADGTRGALLASEKSAADGSYSVSLASQGAAAVVTSGGTYVDEATGASVTVDASTEMQTFVPSLNGGNISVMVTPLTTIAAAHAAANANVGLVTAIANASKAVNVAFGLSADVDISKTAPDDLTATTTSSSTQAAQYGAILAGLSQTIASAGGQPADVLKLVAAMSQDFTDGVFDGKTHTGASVSAVAAITPAQAQAGLANAVSHFMGGARNKSGLGASAVAPGVSVNGNTRL